MNHSVTHYHNSTVQDRILEPTIQRIIRTAKYIA